MEEGAAVRMKAQQDINHFQAKMNEEQERINQTDEVVAVLQEEFTVRFSPSFLLSAIGSTSHLL